jgi:zinc transport system substrate-binding protein
MKKFASVLFVMIITIFLVACTNSKRADIVTTMFPQYDFARQIVGDKLTVSLLIPAGAEIHDYEASSSDMVAIKESKLFLFTSLEIDTWITDESTIGGEDTIVLNLSTAYTLLPHDEENHPLDESEIEDEHDHDETLHYWVDPTNAIQLIEAILEKIIEIDPENAVFYTSNANAYIETIESLHHDLESFLMSEYVLGSTIYFAGHNAMGLFGERYHLNIVSLFPDFKPDSDLTSNELITFVEEVKAAGTIYLFIEELAEPKAANQVVRELAKEQYVLNLLELHAYHNLSKIDMEDGVSYADLLERNYLNLQIVLDMTSL